MSTAQRLRAQIDMTQFLRCPLPSRYHSHGTNRRALGALWPAGGILELRRYIPYFDKGRVTERASRFLQDIEVID
jgi:hypothetical protein